MKLYHHFKPKQTIIMLLMFVLCSSFYLIPTAHNLEANTKPTSDSSIIWQANILTWNDFQMTPPKDTHSVKAMTNSGISVSMSSSGRKNDTMRFVVNTIFGKNLSWSVTSDSVVLLHEQKHFDITEIFARKLRKYLHEVVVTQKSIPTISSEIRKIITAQQSYQKRYDSETNHSINIEAQIAWNVKVEAELASLGSYQDSLILRPFTRAK